MASGSRFVYWNSFDLQEILNHLKQDQIVIADMERFASGWDPHRDIFAACSKSARDWDD